MNYYTHQVSATAWGFTVETAEYTVVANSLPGAAGNVEMTKEQAEAAMAEYVAMAQASTTVAE